MQVGRIAGEIRPKAVSEILSVKNGRSIMYVKLKMALYGIYQAAMLFWNTDCEVRERVF